LGDHKGRPYTLKILIMKASADLTWMFGIVISILLSLVVYFVRLLHVDFRRMQKDIAEVKTTTQLIKSEFKGGLELINQRVNQLEAKVKQFETIFYNLIHYGKE
jgi:glutaredoxin-related protein